MTAQGKSRVRDARSRNLERRRPRAGDRARRGRAHRARSRRGQEHGADPGGNRGDRRGPPGRTALDRRRQNARARTVRNTQLRTPNRNERRVDRACIENGRRRRSPRRHHHGESLPEHRGADDTQAQTPTEALAPIAANTPCKWKPIASEYLVPMPEVGRRTRVRIGETLYDLHQGHGPLQCDGARARNRARMYTV